MAINQLIMLTLWSGFLDRKALAENNGQKCYAD